MTKYQVTRTYYVDIDWDSMEIVNPKYSAEKIRHDHSTDIAEAATYIVDGGDLGGELTFGTYKDSEGKDIFTVDNDGGWSLDDEWGTVKFSSTEGETSLIEERVS